MNGDERERKKERVKWIKVMERRERRLKRNLDKCRCKKDKEG